MASCADPESCIRVGPTLTVYLVVEGRKDQNTTECESSLARQ